MEAEQATDEPRWRLLGDDPVGGAVVFLAQAGYHLDDICAAGAELRRRGHPVAIISPAPPSGALRSWRSSWRRNQELVARSNLVGLSVGDSLTDGDVAGGAATLVVRNDWGPSRTLVERCRAAGVVTVGWVEGVQDFDDVDTGRERRAYRTVDHVLCLGDHDSDQLVGCNTRVVGTQRLWSLWRGQPTARVIDVVANVNFTYGVLERERARWWRQVRDAAAGAGRELVLSRHPADRGLSGRRFETDEPVDRLLGQAHTLVSRFSTLCYEALVRGVQLVYHNPHGERVGTFHDPRGAFAVTTSRDELRRVLSAPVPQAAEIRSSATEFLGYHLSLGEPSPAQRAADAIEEWI